MDELLKFLVSNLSFLYKDFEFKIVDSIHSDSFGGDGMLVLRSTEIELRLLNDRGQLFLDFRSTKYDKPKKWYRSNLVLSVICNHDTHSSVIDSEIAKLIRRNFCAILDHFSREKVHQTISSLIKLEKKRAKSRFVSIQ